MDSLKERVTAAVQRLRQKYGWLDHTIKMVQHYSLVNGNGQAGAVTFFGFLSFFPILALAFFVVGIVAHVYPDVRSQLVGEVSRLLPGVVGDNEGEISLSTIEDYSGRVGIIGLVAVLYSGLGWLSGMRMSLEVMFVVPRAEHTNFLFGKLRDLGTLALIGLTLLTSVALSGAVTGFSGLILELVGIDPTARAPAVLLSLVGHLLAIAASALLLMTMFKLLVVDSHVPRGALVRGAVLGAVGFEVLKLAANLLLAQTRGNPAFQAFGVALILVVWINYFSRLVMLSAAWAYTSPLALAQRTAEAMRAPGAALATDAPVTADASRAAIEEVVGARGSDVASPVEARGSDVSGPVEARGSDVSGPVEARGSDVSGPVEAEQPRRLPWLLAGLSAAVAGVAAIVVRGVRR